MKYAIIDISSSSISLLVAEGKKTFDVLLRERENVSILHYMEGKNLSERGVEKLVENLNKIKGVCRKMEIDKCYVISTASMRNFDNFEWVLSELKRRAAVSVNLLDGQEEAYCDLISNEGYRALDRAVLTDIGGGSIELCDLTQNNPDALVYLDFGPIQLNRRFVENIHPTEEEAKDIKKFVRKKLEKSGLPGDSAFSTAVLVGATNQAIYDVYCDYYDAEKEGEKRIEYDRLKKLCKHLVRSSDRSMLVLKNAPEKIYTLTTAAVILRAMLKYFGVSNIVVSDFGVKEGYLALVTDGRWEGTETDLGEVPAAETAVLSLPGEPSAKKKKKAKKAAETAEESKADTKETDSSQPAPAVKRRGRPRKATPAVAETDKTEKPTKKATKEKAAVPTEAPAAKRRGRPRKTAPAAAETDKAATVKKENKAEVPASAETPAKRRGRPRKTPAPAGVSEPEKAAEIPAESPAKAPARKRAAKRATKTSGTAETEKTAEAIVTPEEIAVQPEEKTAAVSSETAVKAPAAAPRRSRAKKAAATTAKRRAVKKAAAEKAAGAQPEAATETQPESVPEPGKPADSEETQKTENVPESAEVGTIEAATAAASEIPAAESAANGGETAAENAEMAAEGVLKAGEGVKEGES